LQDADAEDVTQTVLMLLDRKMSTFAYDPSRSFHSWLKTLTQRAGSDFVASRKRATQGSGDSQLDRLLQNTMAKISAEPLRIWLSLSGSRFGRMNP
jgi:RNA polymerase sigma-70 factor (ECF subfamily)